jgi:hypothetical protein
MSTLHALPHVKAKGWPTAKLLIVVVESTVDHVSAAAGGGPIVAAAAVVVADVAVCRVAPNCVVAIVKVLKMTAAPLTEPPNPKSVPQPKPLVAYVNEVENENELREFMEVAAAVNPQA